MPIFQELKATLVENEDVITYEDIPHEERHIIELFVSPSNAWNEKFDRNLYEYQTDLESLIEKLGVRSEEHEQLHDHYDEEADFGWFYEEIAHALENDDFAFHIVAPGTGYETEMEGVFSFSIDDFDPGKSLGKTKVTVTVDLDKLLDVFKESYGYYFPKWLQRAQIVGKEKMK